MPVSPKTGVWARLRGAGTGLRGHATPGALELATSPGVVYACAVYRDRAAFGWLLGRRHVETFTTALDPRDPHSVQRALGAAAYRDQAGDDYDEAVVLSYSIDVYQTGPDGTVGEQVVFDYRWSLDLG